jgi:hypothetical protein
VVGRIPGSVVYRDMDHHPQAIREAGIVIFRFDSLVYFGNANYLFDEMQRMGEIADKEGASIELARQPDGSFVVASAGRYPTKADAVKKILEKLLALRSIAVAAINPKSHAGLDVAEGSAQRDVRLLDAGGAEIARIFLGRSVASGAFVRRSGANEVHRVGEAITWEFSTAPASYIDTQLILFDAAQAASVSITRGAGGAVVLERGEGDAWKLKSPVELEAAKDKVDEVLRTASRVYFTRPVAAAAAAEHGLEKPAVAVEVKLKDGAVHRLEIGAPISGATGRYARKGGSPFVVEVSEQTLTSLDKDAAHFQPPPPPAPAAPAAPLPVPPVPPK